MTTHPANIADTDIKDLEKQKFVLDVNGDVALRTDITTGVLTIGAVSLKDGIAATTATVKTDGTNNALVVTQNTQPNPSNLDVALSTRLKPADTLTAVTTVGTITNPVTVAQDTGTSLHTVVDSGTVTANIAGSISNTSFGATQSNFSNLKSEAHLYDSATNGIGSTSNALDVNIKSGSISNTSFNVGTVTTLPNITGSVGLNAGSNTIGNVILTDEYGFDVENTPMGEIRTIEPIRLVGVNFDGNTIDSNFWTSASAGGSGAAITQLGNRIILTSGTAASTTTLVSIRKGRYVGGCCNRYRSVIQNDAGQTNNTRRWGAANVSNYKFTITSANVVAGDIYTVNNQQFTVLQSGTGVTTIHCSGTGAPSASGTLTQTVGSGGNLTYSAFVVQSVPFDGAWFQLAGTTLSIVTMVGGSPTVVSSGSFNGSLGASYSIGTNLTTYEIYWTNSKVWFVIGGIILHTFSTTTTDWSNTLTLQVYADNINSNTATSAVMGIRTSTIYRLGKISTESLFKYISTAGTYVLKYSSGRLKRFVLNAPVSGTITIYDGISASGGNTIGVITSNGLTGNWEYDLPFFNGLTIVTSASQLVTVVYE